MYLRSQYYDGSAAPPQWAQPLSAGRYYTLYISIICVGTRINYIYTICTLTRKIVRLAEWLVLYSVLTPGRKNFASTYTCTQNAGEVTHFGVVLGGGEVRDKLRSVRTRYEQNKKMYSRLWR